MEMNEILTHLGFRMDSRRPPVFKVQIKEPEKIKKI